MANKHMNDAQYHNTTNTVEGLKVKKLKRLTKSSNDGQVEHVEISYDIQDCKMVQPLWKTILQFLNK